MNVSRKINEIQRCSMLYRNSMSEETGIGGHAFSYMFRIYHHPGLRQDELRKEMHVNKSNVTRVLAHLEEKEMIYRTVDPTDRRAVNVYLTPKGEQLIPKLRKIVKTWNEQLSQSFDETEWEDFMKKLDIVCERAVQMVEELEREDAK